MTEAFSTGDKLTLTIKAGKGFDDPWIVVHGSSVEEACGLLRQIDPSVGDALDAQDLPLAVAQAAVNLGAKMNLTRSLNITPAIAAPVELPPAAAAAVQETFPTTPPTWGSAPSASAQQFAPALAPVPAPQQYAMAGAPQQAPAQWGGGAAQANGNSFSPPQPGPAPIGASGFPMEWKTGIDKNGKPWKAWMSGQPKANIDAGQPKDLVQWIR